jgi:hypothetical protein
MKYLKTFESHGTHLAEDIAKDLLPRLKEIKSEKGFFTTSMFDNYMEERKGNLKLTDEVMGYLVNMGFDFDTDEDDEDDGFDDISMFDYNLN